MLSTKIFNFFRITKNLFNRPRFAFAVHLSCDHNSYDLNNLTLESNGESTNNKLNDQYNRILLNRIYHICNRNERINTKNNNVDLSSREVFLSTIYRFLKSNINTITASEIVQILILLRKLKTSSSDKIIHLILNHLSSCLHDLSVIEINKLSMFFRVQGNKNFYKDIQSSLSKHFIKKLGSGIKENNIQYLVSVISFIGCNLNDKELLSTFIKKLQNYDGKISLKSAILIFESFVYVSDFTKDFLDVLTRIEISIINKSDELTNDQINFLILLVSKAIGFNRKSELYNPEFLNKIISTLIVRDMGLNSALSALKCLSYIRHLNKDLVNYACTKYFEETYLLQNKIEKELPKLMTLISSLALINENQVFWNKIKSYILENKEIFTYDHQTLCILSYNLLILNCYPIDIFQHIFNDKYEFSNNTYLQWTFCKIYQILKLNPNYNGPMPSKKHIEALKSFSLNNNLLYSRKHDYFLSLEKYLEREIGGQKYVLTNLLTKLFHCIDFVIVFQRNGTPLAINTKTYNEKASLYLEDFKFPLGSKIVIIQCYRNHWYFRNSDTVVGIHKSFIETLQAMSYIVIPMSQSKWYKTPKSERATYLKNEIQSKIQENKLKAKSELI